MRLRGIKKKVYWLTYDKPGIQKKALRMTRSFDEVKNFLGGSRKTTKK